MNIVLHSGGLDSHLVWLRTRYQPVYVRYGGAAEESELAALRHLAGSVPGFSFRIVEGPLLTGLTELDGHIPHRNAALITAAAATTGADRIAYGALLGEASGDKSFGFRVAMTATLSLGEGRRIRVEAPLARLTKVGALRRALILYREDVLLVLPYLVACYHGTWCGQCQGCYRRALAEWRCNLLPNPPRLPVETRGPVAALRTVPVRRWPGMAVANIPSVCAEVRRRW